MKETANKRNSNIELLRIISMIMIILHHSYIHSDIKNHLSNTNYIIFAILSLIGQLAINIFIIITGYYMVNKKTNKKSIAKLIFETIFYSYLILILYLKFSPHKQYSTILKLCTPITSDSHWFITAYILLYISIPFINKLIENLDKKQFAQLNIFFIICFSIFPSIFILLHYFSAYTWFVALYCIGAYLRLYKDNIKFRDSNIILILSIISLIFIVIIQIQYKTSFINLNYTSNFLSLLISIGIFMLFINFKDFKSIIINSIASSTFGIYLLHDNFLVRDFIWKKLHIEDFMVEKHFWIREILLVLTIFVIGLVIDKLRQICIEKPIFKLWNRIETKNKNKIKQFDKS